MSGTRDAPSDSGLNPLIGDNGRIWRWRGTPGWQLIPLRLEQSLIDQLATGSHVQAEQITPKKKSILVYNGIPVGGI